MSLRNRWVVGDYLMTDDLSGTVHYASEMRKTWDGLWTRSDRWYERNPQDFVRALNDPEVLRDVRDGQPPSGGYNAIKPLIGATIRRTRTAPYTHIIDVGIGVAVVGQTLVVR